MQRRGSKEKHCVHRAANMMHVDSHKKMRAYMSLGKTACLYPEAMEHK